MDSDRARAVYTGYTNDKGAFSRRGLRPRWQSGIRLTKASWSAKLRTPRMS